MVINLTGLSLHIKSDNIDPACIMGYNILIDLCKNSQSNALGRGVRLPQDSPKVASSFLLAPGWAPLPMSLCGTRAAVASWVIRT